MKKETLFIAGAIACSVTFFSGRGALAETATAPAPLLDPLFHDHAVLQRGEPIPVWGEAAPGATVTVTLSGASQSAKADATGHWRLAMPALEAGGPYTLQAASDSGTTETASDVLVGDVYLCAGQSNMVLGVNRAFNSRAEIEDSADDGIRLLTVPMETSLVPREAFVRPAPWVAASPETVPEFSAACFYFARELRKQMHVPLGLIDASWGGANILTFMSESAIRKAGGNDIDLAALDLYRNDSGAGLARWSELWESWWHGYAATHGEPSEPWSDSLDTGSWTAAPAGLGRWDDWSGTPLPGFTGQVWYRTTVNVSAEQAREVGTLSLGPINEEDMSFVDGKVVGTTFGYGSERVYQLPPGALHAGANTVTVSVLCTYRGCGMLRSAARRGAAFADGSSVSLAEPWRYRIGAKSGVPRAPWGAVAGLGMAYNGMIAPLAGYGVRGVIWYQGESNTGDAQAYRGLLSGMMSDWRGDFGKDTPFLIVQLPDYGKPPIKPEESGWAELRDAQRDVVAHDPHSALIVTIDIGEHYDLHPPDKQDLGKRLVRAALHLIYGEPIFPGGPLALGVERQRGRVLVAFGRVENGLVAYGAPAPIGFELCGPAQASCRYASAHILGTTVALDVPAKFTPSHVRYCWADGPICTLFDGADLPAAPFDLPIAGKQRATAPARAKSRLHTAKAR